MLQPKHRLNEWIKKKKKIHIFAVYKRLQIQRYIQTKSERMEKGIPCNGNQKKAEVAILIKDKKKH